MVTATSLRPVGELLREWRQRRRFSQLELAACAGVSTRHISFVETGRSLPSRGMILRLADRLEVPLRHRNDLLVAAGYASLYRERPLDDPQMTPVRRALNRVLDGHEPYPAFAVDRLWNLVMANEAAMLLLDGVAEELLRPPVNVHRLALHPRGLAPLTINIAEVRAHLVARMARQVMVTGDPQLAALHEETKAYGPVKAPAPETGHDVALPTRLRRGDRVLSFLSTVSVFGAPADVTLSELTIAAFFPADDETARALHERVR